MSYRYLFILAFSLFACEQLPKNKEQKNQHNLVENNLKKSDDKTFQDEISFAKFCLVQLNKSNFEVLKPYVDTSILFSPYTFLEKDELQRFSLDDLAQKQLVEYRWGVYDGSGEPIDLSVKAYFEKFVFNFDYTANTVKTTVYEGLIPSRGNELNNINQQFPNTKTVEFYHPPTSYGDLDWNCLLLIIDSQQGKFKLRAIVHNQWTI